MKSLRMISILVGLLVIIATTSLCINLYTYAGTNYEYLICLIILVGIYTTMQVIKLLTRISDYLNLFKKL